MIILRLLDMDTFVRGVTMNYTGEWIEEVTITHNAFKAKEFDLNDDMLPEISTWIRKHESALLEVVTIIQRNLNDNME